MSTSYSPTLKRPHHRLTVATAATNRLLTSASRVKSSLGITDSTQDSLIGELIRRVSDEILVYLRYPRADDGTIPTLGRESFVETIRYAYGVYELFLTRRPIATISSVVEDGTTLTEGTHFQVNKNAGVLERLDGDDITSWSADKIVVTYSAGYILPDDEGTRDLPYEIEEAAIYTVLARMSDLDPSAVDPEVKSETLFEVYSASYANAGTSGRAFGDAGTLPHRAMALLAAHRIPMI